jgi:hypothetical protein
VIRFGDGDMWLRVMVKVDPPRRFDAEADLRRRIKEAFEHEGIPMAGAESRVYVRASSPEVKT